MASVNDHPDSGSLPLADLFDLSRVPRAALVATIAINLLGLAMPLVVLQIYDRVIPNQGSETLFLLIAGLCGTILIDAVLKIARATLMSWSAAQDSTLALIETADALAATPATTLESDRPTDWLDRIEAVAEVEAGRGGQTRLAILDLAFVPVFVLFIALVGGALVLVPIAVMAGFLMMVRKQSSRLGAAAADRNQHDRRKLDFLTECLGALQTVKGLSMEPQMMRRFERLQKTGARVTLTHIEESQALQTLAGSAANVSMVLLVSFGALLIIFGNLTIGAVACCSLLAGRLMQPVLRAASFWSDLERQRIAERRAAPITAMIAQKRVRATAVPAIPPVSQPTIVTLSGVCATLHDGTPILRHVDLTIDPGAIVAISAASVPVRTGFFDILCGDRPIEAGSVRVGDFDPWHLGDDGCSRIVRVTGRATLFRGTILENLTLFQRGEAVWEAREAARMIGLDDAISRLPAGYDTPVGDSATCPLPGGLRQQITIARALAARPGLLILDEVNTALDAAADVRLREALLSVAGTMTILIASFRPSFLAVAGQQFELKDGQVFPLLDDHRPAAMDGLSSPGPSAGQV